MGLRLFLVCNFRHTSFCRQTLIVNQGALSSQLLLGRIQEETLLSSLLLTQSSAAFIIQLLGVGSAALFYMSALPLFFVLVLNRFIAQRGQVSLWTYALGQLSPLLDSPILFASVSQVFVPLVSPSEQCICNNVNMIYVNYRLDV
jgi:hypothetical protein